MRSAGQGGGGRGRSGEGAGTVWLAEGGGVWQGVAFHGFVFGVGPLGVAEARQQETMRAAAGSYVPPVGFGYGGLM